jgi:hypothetical protein
VADDDIVGLHVDPGAYEGDAGRRRGLAGDGEEGLGDVDLGLAHVDHAAHLEHDCSRALGANRGLQASGAIGRKGRDAQDPPTAPSACGGGRALRPGECRRLGR